MGMNIHMSVLCICRALASCLCTVPVMQVKKIKVELIFKFFVSKVAIFCFRHFVFFLYPSNSATVECSRNCASTSAQFLGLLEEELHCNYYAVHCLTC
jgi:hypothetical protein